MILGVLSRCCPKRRCLPAPVILVTRVLELDVEERCLDAVAIASANEHPPRRIAKTARREARCPRLVSAARLGPVLVGLLSTFRGDAAG